MRLASSINYDPPTNCFSNNALPLPSFLRVLATEEFLEEKFDQNDHLFSDLEIVLEEPVKQAIVAQTKIEDMSKNTSIPEISSAEIVPKKNQKQMINLHNMKGLSFY